MPVEKPSWTERAAKFVKKGRGGPVVGIVLHDTAGSGTHGDTLYLVSPGDGRKVAIDFTVEKDGSIWKLNPDLVNDWTPHAGRATAFKGLRNNDVTKVCIGIEIVQKADLSKVQPPLYPEAQVRSVAHLCAWLAQELKLETGDITTHGNIITDGSRSDPRKFPFEEFWSYYWQALGKADEHEASKEIVKTPLDERSTHTVEPGETLSAIARKYGISDWTKIQQANKLTSTTILPGQVLVIP
jgi:N-acetyl-anhydromuramyl-L-alanine amidase AmpD